MPRGRPVPCRSTFRLSLRTARNDGARTRPCLRQNDLATACPTSEIAVSTRLELRACEQLRSRTFRIAEMRVLVHVLQFETARRVADGQG